MSATIDRTALGLDPALLLAGFRELHPRVVASLLTYEDHDSIVDGASGLYWRISRSAVRSDLVVYHRVSGDPRTTAELDTLGTPELINVNLLDAASPAAPSPLGTLQHARTTLLVAGDAVARYSERPLPELSLSTIPEAVRRACDVLVPFVEARRELDRALGEAAPVLERLRGDASRVDIINSPSTPLACLRQSPDPISTAPTLLDALEEAVREARGVVQVVADAWPTITARLTADVTAFNEALATFPVERERIKGDILATIEAVERSGRRGAVLSLDALGASKQQEQDCRVVIGQIAAALA